MRLADEDGKVRRLLDAANEVRERSIPAPRVELLVDMAVAYSRARDVVKSEAMFDLAFKAASGIADSRDRYDALLQLAVGWVEVGNMDSAVRVSALATSREHRAGILGQVAFALADASRTQDALTVARLIPEQCQVERAAAICYVAGAMATNGDGVQALTVIDEVNIDLASADRVRLRQKEVTDSTPAVQEILSAAANKAAAILSVTQCFARAREYATATNTAENISFGGFRDHALRLIASIAADAGDLEAAHRIASQVRNKEEKESALGTIAVEEAARGLIDDSLRTAAVLIRRDARHETMMHIAVALAERGDLKGAERQFAAVNEVQLDPTVLAAERAALARAFADGGAVGSAEKLVEGILDESTKARTMVAVATAYARNRDANNAQRSFQTAYEYAVRIGNSYQQVTVLCELAQSRIAGGDIDGGVHVLNNAAKVATSIPGEAGANVTALQKVAVLQAKSGDQAAAGATFRLALSSANAYDDEEYAATLCQKVLE